MSAANPRPAPVVVRVQEPYSNWRDMIRLLPASIASAIFHAVLILLIWLVPWGNDTRKETVAAGSEGTSGPVMAAPETKDPFLVEDFNPLSVDLSTEIVYKGERKAEESVPGEHLPRETIGILGGDPTGLPTSLPPPPGFGKIGQGGTILEGPLATATGLGTLGGYGARGIGIPYAGSFYGRSGTTKEYALKSGGGTGESEAAVARGLKWIVRMQYADGSWHLDSPKFKEAGIKNDAAGTAFGLLPLLGAGKTHKTLSMMAPDEQKAMSKDAVDLERQYSQAVYKGLMYLIRTQDKKKGSFDGNMYAHGLATIVMCEAYGLTQDPNLKKYAQMAVNYIVFAQHEAGGWRYGEKQAGDTSVVGWQVMALKSAQMAGLDVPDITMKKATKFLEQVCDKFDETTNPKGTEGYGYTGPGASHTLTAVGLLCRQYIQTWGPKNPRMQKAVGVLKRSPPNLRDMYYCYYATQVMHHLGGEEWDKWNVQMREALIAGQDKSKGEMHGSWGSPGSHVSGRLMQTSLCICTLEVYYRHLPLYFRMTEEMAKD